MDDEHIDAFLDLREEHFEDVIPMLGRLPLCFEAAYAYLSWRDWMTRVELYLMGIPLDLEAANDVFIGALELSSEWASNWWNQNLVLPPNW